MYQEINRQLEEAQHKIMRLQKINSMLEELVSQKENLNEKILELKNILDKEDIDVEKLEGKSIAHIFYVIRGSLDKHLEKERQEALAAQMKYDQAVKEMDYINTEIHKLISEKDQYKDCQDQYNRLYSQKKDLLIRENADQAGKILRLTEQINITKNNRKEISEAIDAGNIVMEHIKRAADFLDHAEGWGTWDLIGGGLLTDLAKHSDIDDAKAEVEKIQTALSKFRTELADVKIQSIITIDTDGFAKFADFFFDGLVADWNMQSKIHASQESVERTKEEVEKVLYRLHHMEDTENQRVEQLEIELKELITTAK